MPKQPRQPKQPKTVVPEIPFYLPFPSTRPVVKDPNLRSTGGCLDAIPTPVYRIIQQYLFEREYRDFMNTSLSIFQTVKLKLFIIH
jgi:hypothetical protein